MKEPLKTFVAYAREDRSLKEQLELRLLELQKEGEILIWSDRELVAGDAWNDQIHENLDAAGIFILLISNDFLRSDYCFNTEMRLALRREAEDTAIVAPVILTDCAWNTTELAAIQVLPSEGRPVTSSHWAEAGRAIDDVVAGLRRAIEVFRRKNRPTVRWHQRFGAFEWKNELLLAGDRLIASSRGSADGAAPPGLIALDPASGEVDWRVPFEHGANGVNWFDGRLFAGDVGGDLWCVRARDGHLLWRRSLGEPLFSRPIKVSEFDFQAVLAIGHGGLCSLLDVATGEPIYQFRLDGPFRANPVVHQHDIYVASEGGRLYDLTTIGIVKGDARHRVVDIRYHDQFSDSGWSQASVYSDVIIRDEELIVSFVRQTSYERPAVVSLDRRSLAVRHYAEDPEKRVGDFGSIRSTPVLHAGELIWAEPYSNLLVALDGAGRLSWSVSLGKQMFPQWASPVVDPKRNAVYVARESGWLFKVNTASHRKHWGLYLGEQDLAGEVVGALQDDGSEREATNWQNTHSRPLRMTPLYDAARDRLYTGTTDGHLYCIENL